MRPPWTMQLASDVDRDGLGLELVGDPHRVAAEVFRCDADHTVTVRLFEEGIPGEVIDELLERARLRLDQFEDGTPLPAHFRMERAAESATRSVPSLGVDAMWEDHCRIPFPEDARGAEIDGVDLVLLDSLVAGCISSLINTGGAVDHAKVFLLADLTKQIGGVLPQLAGEPRVYFARLAQIANAILLGPSRTSTERE